MIVGSDITIKIWKVKDGSLIKSIDKASDFAITSVKFSHESSNIISACFK